MPVHEGEIQCRCLGAALYAYDEEGNPLVNEVGEMVITKPMPLCLFTFGMTKVIKDIKAVILKCFGIWRHGDWFRFRIMVH
ncbi:MAG: hypothetical protein R2769_17045 [Saprospiraceae bacterium]